MMVKTELKKMGLGLLALTLLTTAACTKAREYETMAKKPEESNKSLISTDEDYLFTAASLQSSRTSSVSTPYAMGSEKLVRFRWTETALVMEQSERDPRYKRSVNNLPILSIPVEHINYNCALDANGECTHKEQKDEKVPWEQRPVFKPDFNKITSQMLDATPVDIDSYLSCAKETSAVLVGYQLTENSLNIRVEKTFLRDSEGDGCSGDERRASDLTFKVQVQYSAVKRSSLISSNYVPVKYPEKDSGIFGFFTTNDVVRDVDNQETVNSEVQFLNRWNPNKKTIVYYLSEAFSKPENAKVKEATIQGVTAINNGFKAAQTDLAIELRDYDPKIIEADLRNNMIVMVEDPIAGPLGYGPTFADPITGEIVNGRTVMYLGNIVQGISRDYELIRQEMLGQAAEVPKISKLNLNQPTAVNLMARQFVKKLNGGAVAGEKTSLSKQLKSVMKTAAAKSSRGTFVDRDRLAEFAKGGVYAKSKVNWVQLRKDLKDKQARNLLTKEEAIQLEFLEEDRKTDLRSRHCFYMGDGIDITANMKKAIREILGEGELPAWHLLDSEKKQQLLTAIVPVVWVPTLVHELGHNLGLRHNFGGSEDKANFYTKEELAQMDISHEIKYSSVMDYAYRSTNELLTLGKYDIAALRFGYQREVELAESGVFEKVNVSLQDDKNEKLQNLKRYRYCTDEHVDANALCKRWDEGTGYLEFVQNQISSYETFYKLRNFRNNRLNFSMYDDGAYAQRIASQMRDLRRIVKLKEWIIVGNPGIPPKEWETNEFLKDLKGASDLAVDFFIKVIKTPDTLCLVNEKATGEKTVERLLVIDNEETECSNIALKAEYEMEGQGGKFLNSIKDKRNTNPYIDQIDVRGIYADKLIAGWVLANRTVGSPSLDATEGTIISDPEYGGSVFQLIAELAFDEVQSKVKFTTTKGSVEIPMLYSLRDSHVMSAPLSRSIRYNFGFNDKAEFMDVLLGNMVAVNGSRTQPADYLSTVAILGVRTAYPNNGTDLRKVTKRTVNGVTYLATPQNVIASILIEAAKTVELLSCIGLDDCADAADPVGQLMNQAAVKKILADVKAGVKAPAGASAAVQAAYGLDPEVLELFLAGGFKSVGFYDSTLQLLPVINL